jgi:hypothetical protein
MFCIVRWRESDALRAKFGFSELIAERVRPKQQLRLDGIQVGQDYETVIEMHQEERS